MNQELFNRIKHAFGWTFGTITVSLILTFLMFAIEHDINTDFSNMGHLIWWWVLTVSGIGSGDLNPTTFFGRIFGGLVIASSLFLFAIVVSEVTAVIKLMYDYKKKGIIRIKYSGHIVIYGYTSLTAGVIKLLKRHFGNELKLVLVSNDIRQNPFPNQVDFIYANPITRQTFIEANTKEATAAIILANDRFFQPDAYSLVIASGLEKDNSRLVTLVELMDPEMKDLFKETKIVDAFIDRKELLKDLLEQNEDPQLVRIINKQTSMPETEDHEDLDIDLV